MKETDSQFFCELNEIKLHQYIRLTMGRDKKCNAFHSIAFFERYYFILKRLINMFGCIWHSVLKFGYKLNLI